MLEAPCELVHDQAFNVGRAEDNVQVRDIADMVHEAVPGSRVTLADNAQAGELTARVRARAKIASSISPVMRPVNVFCWLGW